MTIHNLDLARAGLSADPRPEHRWVSRCEGATLIALGVSAAALVMISPLTIPTALGWLIFAGGAVRIAGVTAEPWRPLLWSLAIGPLAAIVAGLGLAVAVADADQIRTILVALFVAEAVSALTAAALTRPGRNGGWGLALTGLLDVAMSGTIAAGWPTGDWVLGMFAALDLLAIGVAMLLL